MDYTENVNIVIPLRVDSEERMDNLAFIISSLLSQTSVSINVLEADTIQHFHPVCERHRFRYQFVYDEDPVFYRTRYLNQLLADAEYPIVGIWDADVIIPPVQLLAGINSIRNGSAMCFPYGGEFIFLDQKQSITIRNHRSTLEEFEIIQAKMKQSVGGAFLVNKNIYMEAGGENERFYGWGPEDVERVKRLEILELPISRISGPLFHLYHPITSPCYDGGEREKQNLRALLDTCKMNKMGLLQEMARIRK